MSKMWEVDPETRSKLVAIQKTNENSKCVDCGAPSPQWASPKFGIFFCLACSGIHRSLGVHISFVRSVTMDSFKNSETARMSAGGNKPWKDFFNTHTSNTMLDRNFDDCTISERYDSEAGEEWKERLTCKVEGTEYVPGTAASSGMHAKQKKAATATDASTPPAGPTSGRNTPNLSRVSSPPQRNASPSQKSRNEAYFASKGAENASRPDDLAPNQGGKYSGFGSEPAPASNSSSQAWDQDPVAALTKGFGWLSSTVTKQAANVNKSYLQPSLKQIQDGEAFAQAQRAAQQFGKDVTYGAKGVGEQFNRFVDPEHAGQGQRDSGVGSGSGGPALSGRRAPEPERKDFWDSFGAAPEGPPRERKDFWDEFANAGEARQGGSKGASSIGTSAMKTGGGSSGGGAASKKEDDGWGDW
ncbi:hypothetical protein MBLNU230_g4885t2 [Neophaeotheca triangularis]